ncbi:MAG: hypothetical protein DCC65_14435 [Planctomycetota bacterium]|nr:MAG: hypothetical protein DCC65_14435 [Planctomycetota bacterium]
MLWGIRRALIVLQRVWALLTLRLLTGIAAELAVSLLVAMLILGLAGPIEVVHYSMESNDDLVHESTAFDIDSVWSAIEAPSVMRIPDKNVSPDAPWLKRASKDIWGHEIAVEWIDPNESCGQSYFAETMAAEASVIRAGKIPFGPKPAMGWTYCLTSTVSTSMSWTFHLLFITGFGLSGALIAFRLFYLLQGSVCSVDNCPAAALVLSQAERACLGLFRSSWYFVAALAIAAVFAAKVTDRISSHTYWVVLGLILFGFFLIAQAATLRILVRYSRFQRLTRLLSCTLSFLLVGGPMVLLVVAGHYSAQNILWKCQMMAREILYAATVGN